MESQRSLRHILLVDDDPNDRVFVIRELRQEFPDLEIQEAATWQQFETALKDKSFDLVITDYDLRWSTGLDILHAVKAQYPHCPTVMFTDSGTQELAVEAMKAGLDDYVLKSSKHMIRLRQAVKTAWKNSQVRQRAAELELRLQFLLNELNVGVFRARTDGQLLEVSDGLLQLLGVSTLAEAQAVFQAHMGMGESAHQLPSHREVEIPQPSGGSLWLQVSETAVQAEGATLIDGLVNNMTSQKQTAAVLRSLNQTLEQRVAQRTARLERLNQELEMFAFSISHDLRAPIRQIDGFAAFLEQQLQAADAAPKSSDRNEPTGENEQSPLHFVERIRKLTARAGRMIDDLLQYSRTGRSEMQYTQVSMQRLVQEVLRQVEPQIKQRTVHWQVDDLPVVMGDRNLLRQVWQNLIENALKYTHGQAIAEIAIGSDRGDEETIFYVRDNGIGFDTAHAGKIFGVFQRLPNARELEGTGVGLANVQRVIHRHQGKVWAKGELNVGATFYFSLPDYEAANT